VRGLARSLGARGVVRINCGAEIPTTSGTCARAGTESGFLECGANRHYNQLALTLADNVQNNSVGRVLSISKTNSYLVG
jgi:hypothetical protein